MESSRSQLLTKLENEQRAAWLRGEKVFVEAFLQRHPDLSRDASSLLHLIEREIVLRREAGEEPAGDEYRQRFPQLSDDLNRVLPKPPDPQRDVATQGVPNIQEQTRRLVTPLGSTNINTSSTRHPTGQALARTLELAAPKSFLEIAPGVRVGSYELLERIGAGQYGEVWRALHVTLRREAALKLPRARDANAETIRLFEREARAIAQLDHPNIIAVYEVAQDQNLVYIATQFIRGTDLKKLLAEKRFTPPQAAELCCTLAAALHHAHATGVVHRDLKPSNVLVDEQGVPHIADFGLAKHFSTEELTITARGDVLGTPAYMSPEQARGESGEATPASDIYSLGVMLYELLTGRRPFEGPPETLYPRIIGEPPRPPRALEPALPRDLETICLKAMAKLPADRYATAEALADDLGRYLRGEPIAARRATLLEKSARWTRRHALQVGGAGALATAAGVGGLLFAAYVGGPHPPRAVRRRTRLTSFPLGAQVSFIPLDAETGLAQPARLEQARAQPWAEFDLLPGNYLVVAQFPDGRFHEVLRRVPTQEETEHYPRMFAHLKWRIVDSVIELNRVYLKHVPSTAGMALFATGESTVARGGEEPRQHRIPAFYLDATEVTVGAYRKAKLTMHPALLKNLPPDDHPITYVSYDWAVAYAEEVGKRLPDEVEFEYAATQGGRAAYPWGDEPRPSEEIWTFGAVGTPAFDRLATEQPVVGLCSNVAEWTTTPYRPVSALTANGAELRLQGAEEAQVVRGGNALDAAGRLAPREPAQAIQRSGTAPDVCKPGLGFRCARSPQPRLNESDFIARLSR